MMKSRASALLGLLLVCALLSVQPSLAGPRLLPAASAALDPDAVTAWNMESVGHFPIAAPYKAMDVAVHEGYAYLAAGGLGLRVVEVVTPTAPSEVTSVWTHNGNGVVADWPYAYVAGGDYFFVIDITDPTSAHEEGRTNPVYSQERLALDGNYAYVTEDTGGLGVVDVSDKVNPNHVELLNTPGNAFDVALSGNHAFVADAAGGLRIIDITTPLTLTEVSFYQWTDQPARGVAVRGDHVYVALTNSGGLRVMDVSTPTAPVEVGHAVLQGDHAYGVELEGDYAYVAVGQHGVSVVNISDPTNPWLVGYYDTSLAWSLDLDGGLIYVADQAGGMRILRFLGFAGYTISGQVLDGTGGPLAGVTVSAGAEVSDVTNEFGEYTIAGLAPGNYTLTPSLSQWTFSPVTRQVEVVDADVTGQDFVGVPLCPEPLAEASISGPTEGMTGTLYAFTAVVSPAGATQPISYTWSPEPASGQGSEGSEYLWSMPGVYSVSLEAENCGGQAGAAHTILIGAGAAQAIEPELGATLVYTDALGSPTVIQVPAGAVTGTVTLVFQPQEGAILPPPGTAFAGHAFTLDAYRGGDRLPGLQLDPPLTATIAYADAEVAGLDEDTLELWVGDGAEWSTEGISVTGRYTAANQLEATVPHLSHFAVFGDQEWRIFLPLVMRGN